MYSCFFLFVSALIPVLLLSWVHSMHSRQKHVSSHRAKPKPGSSGRWTSYPITSNTPSTIQNDPSSSFSSSSFLLSAILIEPAVVMYRGRDTSSHTVDYIEAIYAHPEIRYASIHSGPVGNENLQFIALSKVQYFSEKKPKFLVLAQLFHEDTNNQRFVRNVRHA